jgi:WhiB family transcriptional regulator, redox-sensing transcriptional regulator
MNVPKAPVEIPSPSVQTSPASSSPDTPFDEYAWMLHARCRGVKPTEFFPSDGTGVESAQRVCQECEVRVECLEYALMHRIEHGVWGGASERERRRILRRRREDHPQSQV